MKIGKTIKRIWRDFVRVILGTKEVEEANDSLIAREAEERAVLGLANLALGEGNEQGGHLLLQEFEILKKRNTKWCKDEIKRLGL